VAIARIARDYTRFTRPIRQWHPRACARMHRVIHLRVDVKEAVKDQAFPCPAVKRSVTKNVIPVLSVSQVYSLRRNRLRSGSFLADTFGKAEAENKSMTRRELNRRARDGYSIYIIFYGTPSLLPRENSYVIGSDRISRRKRRPRDFPVEKSSLPISGLISGWT